MDAKKPPMLWRRWGQFQMDDGSYSAGLACRMQEQSCRDCAFLHMVRLPSGRVRRLCALTGIKNPATPCVHFRPAEEETAWSESSDRPRQSLVCRACAHGIVPHIRAALLGVVGCLSGHVVDGAAYPIHCRDFRARGARHAA